MHSLSIWWFGPLSEIHDYFDIAKKYIAKENCFLYLYSFMLGWVSFLWHKSYVEIFFFFFYTSSDKISSGNLFSKIISSGISHLEKYCCTAVAGNSVNGGIWLMWASLPENVFVSDIIPALKSNPSFSGLVMQGQTSNICSVHSPLQPTPLIFQISQHISIYSLIHW